MGKKINRNDFCTICRATECEVFDIIPELRRAYCPFYNDILQPEWALLKGALRNQTSIDVFVIANKNLIPGTYHSKN